MDYASSIRYAGRWIDASDCNHTSAKTLGLICPECKELVFLVEGHTRTLKNDVKKEIKPRFNHYKKSSDDCDLRVNSVSKEHRDQINSIARGQLQDKVKRWFWCIFSNYFLDDRQNKWLLSQFSYALKRASKGILNPVSPAHFGNAFQEVSFSFWEEYIDSFRDFILGEVSPNDTGFKVAVSMYKNISNRKETQIYQNPYELSVAQLDMQLNIVKEILQLLLTTQQNELRNKFCIASFLVLIQFFEETENSLYMKESLEAFNMGREVLKASGIEMASREEQKRHPATYAAQQSLAQYQFAILALIPWGDEFERLEANEKLTKLN